MPTAFITGTSSGLGHGLAEHLSGQGWTVCGCSRRGCDPADVNDRICDLSDHGTVSEALDSLLGTAASLELVVLNAGILGRISKPTETPLDDLKRVMEVNRWANKSVMDWLHAWGRPIAQIVMISSGAAVLGNKGWGGCALSKAALNMLARRYAHEFTQTHITALAPGLIDTPMMDHLCEEADARAFPAPERLREARGTEAMPGPRDAARQVATVLPRLRERPSGSFVDIREMVDPQGYARLFGGRAGHDR